MSVSTPFGQTLECVGCLAIQREMGIPIRLIHGKVVRIAEAYVGRKMEGEE